MRKRAIAYVQGFFRAFGVEAFLLVLAGFFSAFVFLEITNEVVEGESERWDRSISLAVHEMGTPWLDACMRGTTRLGDTPVLLVVLALCTGLLFAMGGRRLPMLLLLVSGAGIGLNVLLKEIFRRQRPEMFLEIIAPHSYSFPSGHAMTSMTVYGMIAIAFGYRFARSRPWFALTVPVVIALIGFSRVYLGVHWATDVLAGFAAGAIIVSAGWLAARHTSVRHR